MKSILSFAVFLLSSMLAIAAPDERSFPDIEIFINNHQFGKNNGCSGGLGKIGKMTCGHPKTVSEVSWELLESTEEGDRYRFVRLFPSDSETPSTETKEVVYRGEVLEIWKDSIQRIVLRSKSKGQVQD
ncbi:MAG: hypothetical protein KDN18_24915 [Verrucomicrobiae bacterium]|nr:hypothetical protein [Verrucomicrobiae bacterium]